ncbi:LLM class flavin-dependent oxidoreductase [Luedemannella helvata]|uniref:LLM class flavin-dependent oxidoreductase n=1 Tax=Luedemannella helvata TaxID=349315 RepID=A0ABP4WXH3_9ACTN
MPDRDLILNAFLMVPGHHAAAWRHPLSTPERTLDLDYYAGIARTAEAAKIDSLFLADGLSSGRRGGARGGLEPLTLLSSLAAVTERIGLIATASTTFNDPYNLARAFASLDHLSGGRAGWNIVTSADTEAAANFSREAVAHEARYRRAHEFLEVATGLWDSWEDDARILDKAAGRPVDGDKVHELNHVGAHFQVRGPLNAPRPPQGHPLLVQAGSSEDGKDFAAHWAEAIFTAQQTIEDARAFYADVKARVAAAGRDPDAVKILPGLSPFIGSTEAEAHAVQSELDDLAVPTDGVPTQVWRQLGTVDLTQFPLDEPVPLHLLPDETDVQGNRSRFALIVSLARRERLTVRQLLRRLAGARGHFTFAGTPEQVADLIEDWFTHGAADGFNIMPPLYPSQFEIFLEHVVPILQRRGLFHTEYRGRTLREHYGLDRPANRFARPRELAA